jgi:hypothetical protein
MIPIRSASITLTDRQTNNMTTARSRGNGSVKRSGGNGSVQNGRDRKPSIFRRLLISRNVSVDTNPHRTVEELKRRAGCNLIHR